MGQGWAQTADSTSLAMEVLRPFVPSSERVSLTALAPPVLVRHLGGPDGVRDGASSVPLTGLGSQQRGSALAAER